MVDITQVWYGDVAYSEDAQPRGGGEFEVTPETHSPGDGNVHGKRGRVAWQGAISPETQASHGQRHITSTSRSVRR